MIDDLVQMLNERSAPLGLPRLHPGLVIGVDADPAGKVTMILLDDGGSPRAVAKVSRRRDDDSRLDAEHSALQRVRQHALPSVGSSVPRPLLLERVAGRPALVTTAVPGAPLSVRYHHPGHVSSPLRVEADFAAAGHWLAAFHSDTGISTVSCEEVWHSQMEPLFARYQASVGWSDWEAGLYGRMLRWVDDLADVPIPLASVHGDYCIGNVLLHGDVVTGVVDWELGREPAVALTDVFKFAASYGSFLDRAAPQRGDGIAGHAGWATARRRWGSSSSWSNLTGFVYTYFGDGWFPELVRDYLMGSYCRLGCPPDVEPLFLVGFVAEQVLTLDNPVYRNGYRDLLRAMAELYEDHRPTRSAVTA